MEGFRMMGNNQRDFVINKLCQINLIVFFDRVVDFVCREEGIDIIYFDFREFFDFVLYDMFINKGGKYGLMLEMD